MRNEMIDLLNDAMSDWDDVISEYQENGEVPPDSFEEHIADYLIANGVTIATDKDVGCKWIPVEEKLPENDLPEDTKRLMIRCLVFTNKGTVKPCVRQRRVGSDGKMVPWEWNKTLHARPTHWMLLPKGTKEEA